MNGAAGGSPARTPTQARTAPAASVARRRAAWPIMLITVLLFGFSGGVLWLLGYNYDGLSGSALTKIHPSTYCIVLLFAWNAVTYGNPVGYAVRGAALHPGSLLLLVALVALFAHTVARETPGMAGAIDTFMPAALLVVIMADIDALGRMRVQLLLHGMMTLNATMAIVEFIIHHRFFPYRFDGAVFPFDVRSTALLGHPLENAAVTAYYVLTLLSGSAALPWALRVFLVPLQYAALVTFGGRTAIVVSVLLGLLYLLREAHRAARAGRVPILAAAAGLIVLSLIPVIAAILASRGFFDMLLGRFESDGGSANARVEMFSLFDTISFRDLLVGPDPGVIETLRRINGLEWGIEQPIVKTLLYHGILITVLMIVALTAFLREVSRLCERGMWLPMLCFVILLQSSESIAGKTTSLTKFTLMMLCCFSAPPLRSVRRLRQAQGGDDGRIKRARRVVHHAHPVE